MFAIALSSFVLYFLHDDSQYKHICLGTREVCNVWRPKQLEQRERETKKICQCNTSETEKNVGAQDKTAKGQKHRNAEDREEGGKEKEREERQMKTDLFIVGWVVAGGLVEWVASDTDAVNATRRCARIRITWSTSLHAARGAVHTRVLVRISAARVKHTYNMNRRGYACEQIVCAICTENSQGLRSIFALVLQNLKTIQKYPGRLISRQMIRSDPMVLTHHQRPLKPITTKLAPQITLTGKQKLPSDDQHCRHDIWAFTPAAKTDSTMKSQHPQLFQFALPRIWFR